MVELEKGQKIKIINSFRPFGSKENVEKDDTGVIYKVHEEKALVVKMNKAGKIWIKAENFDDIALCTKTEENENITNLSSAKSTADELNDNVGRDLLCDALILGTIFAHSNQRPTYRQNPNPYGYYPAPMVVQQYPVQDQAAPHGPPVQQLGLHQQRQPMNNTKSPHSSPKQSAVHPPAQPTAKKSQSSNVELMFTDSEESVVETQKKSPSKQSAVHPPAQPAAKKAQSSNVEFIFTDSESGLKQKRTLKSMQQQKDDSTFIPTLSGENYSQNSNKVDNRSRSGCGCNII